MTEASDPLAHNPVDTCLEFFRKAVPDPAPKNIHTQLGCHFEEVVEMLDIITPLDEETSTLLGNAQEALHALANHLKASDDVITIIEENRVDFLDSVCDQMVTGIGSCHMMNMDVIAGFDEVNASNLSKFDEHGQPIFDGNMKVQKGPGYFKADLQPFV
jgi:predicted HAD superfamily Cof-like phosphohydrolase